MKSLLFVLAAGVFGWGVAEQLQENPKVSMVVGGVAGAAGLVVTLGQERKLQD